MTMNREGEEEKECEHLFRIDNMQCVKCKKILKMDWPPY